jgi:hypothetical protein
MSTHMTTYSKHGAPSPGGPRDAARKNRKLAPGRDLSTEKGRQP